MVINLVPLLHARVAMAQWCWHVLKILPTCNWSCGTSTNVWQVIITSQMAPSCGCKTWTRARIIHSESLEPSMKWSWLRTMVASFGKELAGLWIPDSLSSQLMVWYTFSLTSGTPWFSTPLLTQKHTSTTAGSAPSSSTLFQPRPWWEYPRALVSRSLATSAVRFIWGTRTVMTNLQRAKTVKAKSLYLTLMVTLLRDWQLRNTKYTTEESKPSSPISTFFLSALSVLFNQFKPTKHSFHLINSYG